MLLLVVTNICILVGYAITVKEILDTQIGSVFAITIAAFDIVIFWMVNVSIEEDQSVLLSLSFLNRYLIFMGGESLWIYGYIAFYLCISLYLSTLAVQKMLPYTIVMSKEDMINLKEPKDVFSEKFLRHPIAILIFCTLLIFGILGCLKLVTIKNVSLRHIPFLWGKTLSAFEAFGVAILLVLSYFFLYSLFRSVRQRLLGFPTKTFMVGKFNVNYNKMLFLINWLIHLMLAFFFSWLSDSAIVRECIWIGSGYLLMTAHATACYIKNDFRILEDVKAANKRIKMHNDRIKEIAKKGTTIRQSILDG